MRIVKVTLSMMAVVTALFLSSCQESSELDPLVIPESYDGAAFSTNSTTELAVVAKLKALRDEAFKGRTNGTAVSATTLNSLYTTGTPSLKTLNTTYYNSKIEGDNGYLAQLAAASGNTWNPGNTGAQGGVYGSGSSIYLFDENGMEMEQMIEKGMFASVFYNHAITLMTQPLDEKTTDKLIAIFGAHPDFANSTDATKHTNTDKYAASYAARRDKNDGNGFYTQIRDNLIKLQAAIKAGDNYKADQDEAIIAIRENWEKSSAATVIFYLNDVISKLSQTTQDDATKASALHALSESIAFIHGWKTVPDAHKIITDAEIDEILTLFNSPANGTSTAYLFATDPANQLTKLQSAITELKGIYGFSNEQMEDFKFNWVSVQGR